MEKIGAITSESQPDLPADVMAEKLGVMTPCLSVDV